MPPTNELDLRSCNKSAHSTYVTRAVNDRKMLSAGVSIWIKTAGWNKNQFLQQNLFGCFFSSALVACSLHLFSTIVSVVSTPHKHGAQKKQTGRKTTFNKEHDCGHVQISGMCVCASESRWTITVDPLWPIHQCDWFLLAAIEFLLFAVRPFVLFIRCGVCMCAVDCAHDHLCCCCYCCCCR